MSSSLIVFLLVVPVIFSFFYLFILNFFRGINKNLFQILNIFLILILGLFPLPLLLFFQTAGSYSTINNWWIFFGDYYAFFFTLVVLMQESMKYLLLFLAIILVLIWFPLASSQSLFLSIIPINQAEISEYSNYFYKVRIINTLFFIGYAIFFVLIEKSVLFIKNKLLIVKGKKSLRVIFLIICFMYIYVILVQTVCAKNYFHGQQLSGAALQVFYVLASVTAAITSVLIFKSFIPQNNTALVKTNQFFNKSSQIYNFNGIEGKIRSRQEQYMHLKKNVNYGIHILITTQNKNSRQLIYLTAEINKFRKAFLMEFDIAWAYECNRKHLLFFLAYSPENMRKSVYNIYRKEAIRFVVINRIFREFNKTNNIQLSCKIMCHGLENDNLKSITRMLVLNQYNYSFEQVTRFIQIYNYEIQQSERKNYVLLERFLAMDNKNLAFRRNNVNVLNLKGNVVGYYLGVEKFYEFYDLAIYENIFKRYLIWRSFTKLIHNPEKNKTFFILAPEKLFYDSDKWRFGLKHALSIFQQQNNKICVVFSEAYYQNNFHIIKKIFLFQYYFPNLEICVKECTFSKWICENIVSLKIKYIIPCVDASIIRKDTSSCSAQITSLQKNFKRAAEMYSFNLINTKCGVNYKGEQQWCILNNSTTIERKAETTMLAATKINDTGFQQPTID